MQAISLAHTPFYEITISGFLEISFGTGKKKLSSRRFPTSAFFTKRFTGPFLAQRKENNFIRVMRKSTAFGKKLLNMFFTIQSF